MTNDTQPGKELQPSETLRKDAHGFEMEEIDKE